MRFTLALATLLIVLSISACDDEPAAPPVTCLPTTALPAGERFDQIAVHLEGDDPHLALVRDDLAHYLGRLWGGAFTIGEGQPTAGPAIWLSTSEEARELAGATAIETGYALRRVDDRIVGWGSDAHHLAYASYALLEELGIRFFHPREELVPAFDGAYLPGELSAVREPAFATRGIQLHTLHPIETWRAVTEPGDQNLADAKQFVDWLVKTGHNELQWWIFADTDIEAYRPHAEAIIDYAHLRGVRVGVVAQLWEGGSLQNGYTLVSSETEWQSQLETSLSELYGLGFDLVELGLGEFFAADPALLVAWLDHATAFVAETLPGRELSVVNHVGNYPELYVDYQGQEVFFYHLPGFADPRLINNVHTVFFFDLYRDWGGYGHPTFHDQREFLLGEIGERTVRYIPESAYWVTADTDVPTFLPLYAYSRWRDIAGLHEDGGGAIEGHVMFSSGHEWGYWMADYLAGKMMWEPEAPFERFVSHLGFGSCAPEVSSAIGDLIATQNDYLFDRRLVGYLSGEDTHDDFGYLAGYTTTPRRLSYEEVLALSAAEQQAFRDDVLAGLRGFVGAMQALEGRLAVCANPAPELGSFCREFLAGTIVTRLRAEHSLALYEAVLAGDTAMLDHARQKREEAAAIIDGQAAFYRWSREHLTAPYDNPTIYDFGYLRQAHAMCYWLRQEQQAAGVVETKTPPPIGSLPTCLE